VTDAIELERRHGDYLISADPARLDVAAIHAALSVSYWAAGVTRETVERSLRHSVAVGAYHEPGGPGGPGGPDGSVGPGASAASAAPSRQVGLIRLITDRATFAWVCDVYVVAEHQGRGIAQAMLGALRDHPELQGLRRWLLGTRDAHDLYARFGFRLLNDEEQKRYMIVRDTPYG
jgi:GNAT superfamily N-acetyltransferase